MEWVVEGKGAKVLGKNRVARGAEGGERLFSSTVCASMSEGGS